jgi:hypothetical protein
MIPPLSFMSVSEGVVVTGLVIVLFVFIYWNLRLDFENGGRAPLIVSRIGIPMYRAQYRVVSFKTRSLPVFHGGA